MNLHPEERERYAYITADPVHPVAVEAFERHTLQERIEAAQGYIDEALTGVPDEDCLMGLIDDAMVLAQGRVTKAEVLALAKDLETARNSLWQAAEHTREQLSLAAKALLGET